MIKLVFINDNETDVEETVSVDAELEKRKEEQKLVIDAANAKFADPATDLENMAPKKPNWDLKRQLAPKLALLQKRTQKSLLEILSERAMKIGTGEQLASAVANVPDLSSDEEED